MYETFGQLPRDKETQLLSPRVTYDYFLVFCVGLEWYKSKGLSLILPFNLAWEFHQIPFLVCPSAVNLKKYDGDRYGYGRTSPLLL
jgi:hypothetical protein